MHVRCSSSSTSEHQQPQHQPPTFRVADAREEELSQAVGEQDFVVLCMKQGDQLRDAAKLAQPLLGPSTTVVTLQNGLPFWYFAGCASHEYLPRLQRLPMQPVPPSLPCSRQTGCKRTRSYTAPS